MRIVSRMSADSMSVNPDLLNGTSAELGYTVPFKLDVVEKI